MARRSVQVSVEHHRSGDGLNDNYPSVLPGHELAGLDGLPRPPTAEAVSHYSRFTQIGSYPAHPTEPAPDASEPPVMDMLSAEKPSHVLSAGKKGVTFACIGSCLFHLAVVAAVLLFAVVPPEDEAKEEAGDTLSVIMLGNGDVDATAAGEESKRLPEPEQVTAEAVQPKTVQPTTAEPAEAEAAQPVETVDPVQPTPETAQQVSPETVVTPEPEILASQMPAETTVVQPANAEPVEIQPTETTQAAEPPAEVVTPVDKPVQRPKSVDKPKDIKKQPQKVAKVRAGSNGDSQEDSKRGSSEGTETAQSDKNSQSDARRTGSGNAAIANYRGKVEARLKRYMARLSSKHQQQGLTLVVSLVIGSGGELRSLSLVRSSGDPELDQAAMEQIRRAAPFPALPPEWGKPTWPATQAIRVEGR
ncbi:TonB family protein [Rhizobium sp. ICMP 5592]|uniref:cell envelope integrity protein TolA n=1 Tax=Rhizobium sp. ICMP 5592 TaxID=2292445 RepID=UPI0012957CED|nr:TonB family protein [Rhizobium sp. ICMP 5592]MQB42240.1 TonB family protein [Rhizobium sp. ICMP 5592]